MCDPKGSLSPNRRLGLARRPQAAPISYIHPPLTGIFMPTPSMAVSCLLCPLPRDREGERVDTRKNCHHPCQTLSGLHVPWRPGAEDCRAQQRLSIPVLPPPSEGRRGRKGEVPVCAARGAHGHCPLVKSSSSVSWNLSQ